MCIAFLHFFFKLTLITVARFLAIRLVILYLDIWGQDSAKAGFTIYRKYDILKLSKSSVSDVRLRASTLYP